MALRLTFWGGAGTVTGSNFLVEEDEAKVLIDCGLEQGRDVSGDAMYQPFPYEPASIGALIVTHAHLDHVGRIPKLVRDGFRGPIYMTAPTKELASLILHDSAGILGQDAKAKGLPLMYEEKDVDAAFELVEVVDYGKPFTAAGLTCVMRDTGHILGSGSVRIEGKDGTALALTGDIGNSPSPLLPDWQPVADIDALVMESVYGDRSHPPHEERVEKLRNTLKDAIARGGAVLIPAFSLERTQLMLYELSNFFAQGSLPEVPVYLDSPLAIKVTSVYEKYGPEYFRKDAKAEMLKEKSLFEFPFLTKTESRQESDDIASVPNPKIIIAGAGMSHGGRIGRHEARHLPDSNSTLILVGYQAPGSPGRRMKDGASTVRLDGKDVVMRAKVVNLEGWSAHADRDELMRFAEESISGGRTKVVFTALGEPSSARFLAQRLHDYLGAKAVVPVQGETWEVTKSSVRKL
ncbi:MAG: MBL fold metallo-hydrolase [Candidatus Pacebacteria bacterium]|nr:MBL fold metallo-hydrolase [Candidatus Paceibacterota bacterium]MBP9840186.1 MBL fold metallo-hydrolase [Candidatus Paceibacterota bacterium]